MLDYFLFYLIAISLFLQLTTAWWLYTVSDYTLLTNGFYS